MLNFEETGRLVELLKKAEWPLAPEVFHALMGKIVSVPIELGVFNEKGEILLIYRDDWEFTGWHHPGTVLRDNEDVPGAIARLIRGEVGTEVTKPTALGWLEGRREQEKTRHSVALLHVCFLRSEYTGRGKFFNPNNLPEDTLEHHKTIIPTMIQRAREAGIKLGK